MIQKGALEPVRVSYSPGFYSGIFIVSKSDGVRPIIDLSILNKYLKVMKFKPETAQSIRLALALGMWIYSIDLKERIFMCRFIRVPGSSESCVTGLIYQFRALLFGISIAPWLFTKIMVELKDMLHKRVVPIH